MILAMRPNKSVLLLLQMFASTIVLIVWFYGDISWLAVTLSIGLILGFISILGNRDNLLFFIRTVFIVWIGLIPALALYLGGHFAYRMPFVQTLDVAFILTIITTLALFSSQLGIEVGKKLKVREHGVDMSGGEIKLFYFLLVLVVLVGTLIALRRGDLIIFSGYTSAAQLETRIQLPINNLQSIANILLLFSYVLLFRLKRFGKVSSIRSRRLWILFWTVAVYVAVWCQFLRGARMDPMTLIFALSVLFLLFKKQRLRLNIKVLTYLALAFFVLQVWGGIRHDLSAADISKLESIIHGLYKDDVNSETPIYFRQGTMNNLSLSVATVIYAIEKNDIDYRLGSSYLDYIARTPPAFLYPDRPVSLAWVSAELYGGSGAGGGFNEMAESYINFGVLGSLIIPGVISFILSYSLRQFMINQYNIMRSLVFFSMLAVFFRGLLYESFTFYKVFVTAVIIYGVVLFVHEIFLKQVKTINTMPRNT